MKVRRSWKVVVTSVCVLGGGGQGGRGLVGGGVGGGAGGGVGGGGGKATPI